MKRLYLVGGTALTMDPQMTLVQDSVVEVADGKIVSVSPRPGFKAPAGDETLNCAGSLVMPGLINGHTHTGMTLLRGVADDLPLMQWLMNRVFPLEQKWGKPDFVYLGTQLAALEMIRSGTTTFNDMYYFEADAARAAHESGLRAICGQTVIEMSGVDNPTHDTIAAFERFFDELKDYPRIIPAVAPHSVYGVSEGLMKEVIAFAKRKGVSIHVHMAEVMDEVEECKRRFGMTPVEKALALGAFEVPVVAAHATCVTESDMAIMASHRVGVITNPESNLKLGGRICPIPEFRERGVPVGVGTDSTASNNNLDLLTEAGTMAKLQCFRKGPGSLDVKSVVRMLTIEGAKVLGIDDRVGSLEVGKRADIIAIDINRPHCVPLYDPYSHLVYSSSGHDVRHTIVDGRVLMQDRVVTTLNESDILYRSREFAKRIEPKGLHPTL
ncbi:MAG: amidohydrolase [Deltaproteobacteria bacterium]|nr:amidohydrolase [Deltaproteobacteria bacterium]MBI3296313.1 amidohydrolase [Deltaproteobacteria bacterium]